MVRSVHGAPTQYSIVTVLCARDARVVVNCCRLTRLSAEGSDWSDDGDLGGRRLAFQVELSMFETIRVQADHSGELPAGQYLTYSCSV